MTSTRALDKAGKGSLLRREGLYTSLIGAWRKQRDQAVKEALARPAGVRRRTRGTRSWPGCVSGSCILRASWVESARMASGS